MRGHNVPNVCAHECSTPDARAKKVTVALFFGISRAYNFSLQVHDTQSSAAFALNSTLELKNKTFEEQKRGGAPLRGSEVELMFIASNKQSRDFYD